MMTDDRRYELAPDVVLQDGTDEAILVKLHDENFFGLNRTGADIVRGLSKGLGLAALIAELARAYDAPADGVAQDVEALIAVLEARGLLIASEVA